MAEHYINEALEVLPEEPSYYLRKRNYYLNWKFAEAARIYELLYEKLRDFSVNLAERLEVYRAGGSYETAYNII